MLKYFNEIVIGAGAMGSAAIYNLARIRCEENKVGTSLAIEQFELYHSKGSSGGESRATRVAIAEGSEYVPLAIRSNSLWQEIEKRIGYKPGTLYNPIGGLIISAIGQNEKILHDPDMNYFQESQRIANQYHIPHKILSNLALRNSYPQFAVNDNGIGYAEESMGFLRSDECIKAQLKLAKDYGAKIHTEEKMLEFSQLSDGKIKVTTNKSEYTTNHLILTVAALGLRKY